MVVWLLCVTPKLHWQMFRETRVYNYIEAANRTILIAYKVMFIWIIVDGGEGKFIQELTAYLYDTIIISIGITTITEVWLRNTRD